ncbi:MAG: hypothetical protein M1465_03155 [Candidatus Marsarchaeota archaeon]|jgi:uncharacterized protein YejL (UPF0352 family)|nr:hypothetical protein [Candidatus Marsarchaeota archaeon]
MESKQKSGVEKGEIKAELTGEICDEQSLEQSFADELKAVDLGPMIAAIINEEPDQNTKAAISNAIAQSAIKMVKKADAIRKKKQIRFGPAAVVIAAKE